MTATSFKQYYQGLIVLCIAFITGATLFVSIVLYITSMNNNAPVVTPEQANMLTLAAPVFALVCVLAGSAVFRKKMIRLKELPTVDEKLNAYKFSFIIRYFLMDAPALLASLAYFLTGEKKLLIITGALLCLMLYLLPVKKRLINALDVSSTEADMINNTKLF